VQYGDHHKKQVYGLEKCAEQYKNDPFMAFPHPTGCCTKKIKELHSLLVRVIEPLLSFV